MFFQSKLKKGDSKWLSLSSWLRMISSHLPIGLITRRVFDIQVYMWKILTVGTCFVVIIQGVSWIMLILYRGFGNLPVPTLRLLSFYNMGLYIIVLNILFFEIHPILPMAMKWLNTRLLRIRRRELTPLLPPDLEAEPSFHYFTDYYAICMCRVLP